MGRLAHDRFLDGPAYRVTIVARGPAANPQDGSERFVRTVKPRADNTPGLYGGVIYGSTRQDGLAVELRPGDGDDLSDVLHWWWVRGFPSPVTHELIACVPVPSWEDGAEE
jgi:hypothetical protein